MILYNWVFQLVYNLLQFGVSRDIACLCSLKYMLLTLIVYIIISNCSLLDMARFFTHCPLKCFILCAGGVLLSVVHPCLHGTVHHCQIQKNLVIRSKNGVAIVQCGEHIKCCFLSDYGQSVRFLNRFGKLF